MDPMGHINPCLKCRLSVVNHARRLVNHSSKPKLKEIQEASSKARAVSRHTTERSLVFKPKEQKHSRRKYTLYDKLETRTRSQIATTVRKTRPGK